MKSVLIDSNLLLLYLVGNIEARQVGRKRLNDYDLEHLDLLNSKVSQFPRHVSVPNILTEVSNFIGDEKQEVCRGATAIFARYCHRLAEIYHPSEELVASDAFRKFGLADAAVARIGRSGVTVLTDDGHLYGYLVNKGLRAINIWHDRTPQ